ncbi:hypothetical protein VIGAN_04429200 [Vigna angularis var. angularis]|uniref:Uncharacterized protein n=1 Tax=Vigna angularis var. angularis TaxID=157739 RepID=A0A0S3S198_PHAAN|nr:hypothetical protein VIGAN_04429200 [Vigna angularis var. angularis]
MGKTFRLNFHSYIWKFLGVIVCSEKMGEFTYHARKVEGKQRAVLCPITGTHATSYSLQVNVHQLIKNNFARNPKPIFFCLFLLTVLKSEKLKERCLII